METGITQASEQWSHKNKETIGHHWTSSSYNVQVSNAIGRDVWWIKNEATPPSHMCPCFSSCSSTMEEVNLTSFELLWKLKMQIHKEWTLERALERHQVLFMWIIPFGCWSALNYKITLVQIITGQKDVSTKQPLQSFMLTMYENLLQALTKPSIS